MFLVHQARDVMDRDILLLQAAMSFDTFLRQPTHEGKIRHVVLARDDRIVGVLRVNTGIRHGLESVDTGAKLDDARVAILPSLTRRILCSVLSGAGGGAVR